MSTSEKDVTKGIRPAGLPDGIPPVGSKWALFQPYVLTVNLADNGDPPDANLPETSTPIKATPESRKCHTKKRLNISKIEASHLLFDMPDQQEKAWRSVESEDQAAVPNQISGKGSGSGRELPHGLPATLPDRPGKDRMPTVPLDPTLEAPKWDNKCPHDDDDEIMEVPDEDKPAEPPKKKKKKKKNKDSKEAVPTREGEDDGTRPGTSMVEPEDVADEATPVPVPTEVLAEEIKAPKKKKQKKKDAEFEKFWLEQREAKEMSKVKHRKLQCEQDFRAVRNYGKSIPGALLETINGADHRSYLLERFQKENNYMSKKCSHKWNLMTVEHLLTRIAKYANEPTKRLKEAQQIIKSNFPMVQEMPSGDKCTPEFAVHVLMDCEGNLIDCNHQVYGKEQNIGLHDVVSPAAMARVTAQEIYIVDGIPTSIKADNAFYPFCAYTTSNHRAINNHVWMHFRAIMVCGWPSCYFMHMQSKKMIEHSAEAHDMARAKPAREKGGD